jgi:hypothetical protein
MTIKIIFLHGLESGPNGIKAKFLSTNPKYTVFVPQLKKYNVFLSLYIIIQSIQSFNPDLIIGSSYGATLLCFIIQMGLWTGPSIFLSCALATMSPARLWLPKINTYTFIHGIHDSICPIEPIRKLSLSVNAVMYEIQDTHSLKSILQPTLYQIIDQSVHFKPTISSIKMSNVKLWIYIIYIVVHSIFTYPFYFILNKQE